MGGVLSDSSLLLIFPHNRISTCIYHHSSGMDCMCCTALEDVPLGASETRVVVSVDRVIIRERVISVGDPSFVAKYVNSVDVVMWDSQVYTLSFLTSQ